MRNFYRPVDLRSRHEMTQFLSSHFRYPTMNSWNGCTSYACSDSMLTVDFGDGRVAEYEKSDLELLDLAYASTIHKSQGSEYKSVIINLQCAHAVMLVRPLVYTAITRAKERVIIVGERRALCIAIRRTDTEQRGTKLAARIRSLATACDTRMLVN